MKLTLWTLPAFFVLGIFLFLYFRIDYKKSPRNRKLVSAVLGLMAAMTGYFGVLNGNESINQNRLILFTLPLLGGMGLLLTVFVKKLQVNWLENISGALVASWISPILLSWASLQAQNIVALVIILNGMLIQFIEKKSLPPI